MLIVVGIDKRMVLSAVAGICNTPTQRSPRGFLTATTIARQPIARFSTGIDQQVTLRVQSQRPATPLRLRSDIVRFHGESSSCSLADGAKSQLAEPARICLVRSSLPSITPRLGRLGGLGPRSLGSAQASAQVLARCGDARHLVATLHAFGRPVQERANSRSERANNKPANRANMIIRHAHFLSAEGLICHG